MEHLQIGLESHLLQLHQISKDNITKSARYRPQELGKVLQIDAEIRLWEKHLANRPEIPLLAHARRELGFAVYAAASGLYGHAFAGLRLFLELSFASVHFSANELHRRKWIANRADFSWSTALDEDAGVLSKAFVREFNSQAVDDCGEYSKMASAAYRECSEFMHGKLEVTRHIPETLSFSEAMIARWTKVAVRSAEAVLFLLFCRYGDDYLSNETSELVETLEHSLSHLVSVRKALGLPVEIGE